MSIVSQNTSDSKTIFPCDHRLFIIQLLDFPLNRTNATDLLFQFLLCMAICFVDQFRRFPQIMKVAPEADLRTDLPRYRVYRVGNLVKESEDIVSLWQEDFVAFLLGCSFSAEQALIAQGIRLRHLEQGTNVAMYRTALPCPPRPRLHGPRVVSMWPIAKGMAERVAQITGGYPLAHGAPVHIGDPAALGTADLAHPDRGDAVEVTEDDIPMLWACGVTSQAILMQAKPEIAITHSPGAYVSDRLDGCGHLPAHELRATPGMEESPTLWETGVRSSIGINARPHFPRPAELKETFKHIAQRRGNAGDMV